MTNVPYVDFLLCVMAGAAGGLTSFLVGIRAQHYKNNKYFAKLTLEVLGGAITSGGLIYVIFDGNRYVFAFAFLAGTAWSQIIQNIRTKITDIIEAALKASGSSK